MPHFFINSKNVQNNKVSIFDKENYNHIAKSLRAKVGENLLLIDENQIQYETVISDISNKIITADIQNQYKSALQQFLSSLHQIKFPTNIPP